MNEKTPLESSSRAIIKSYKVFSGRISCQLPTCEAGLLADCDSYASRSIRSTDSAPECCNLSCCGAELAAGGCCDAECCSSNCCGAGLAAGGCCDTGYCSLNYCGAESTVGRCCDGYCYFASESLNRRRIVECFHRYGFRHCPSQSFQPDKC